ncbi:MAG TPA: polysaccharide deacetylase family protein [Terriglobales bacterium]|jgi:peptidoglycan/xylan/chitin deacetylase (PgdA/CDA1 family)|nr:polysaccharide deacetylase family protein [Terriglobales bacterium]
MNRRKFVKLATAAPMLCIPSLWATNAPKEIAFTFDDPKTDTVANLPCQEINQRMLATLDKRKLKAVLYVVGKRIDSPEGKQIVSSWDRAGHDIGNHSYSHFNFNGDTTLAEFEADFTRNEPLIRDYEHFVPLFRFPFFKEGNTAGKRDGMRAFLKQHGYRSGRATIDASDWAIDDRLNARKKEPTAYRDFYLQHIWERAQFYDSLAQRLLNRPVRHTVLLHHSALNALFLDDVIAMFIAKGWKPIDAKWAYADPIYDRQPRTLPAGEGLIWALAKESGKFEKELRYPAEDDVYENPKMDALGL